MKTIGISEFKARCSSLLDQVKKTGQRLLITKRGEPVAQVGPAAPPEPPAGSAFGSMAGSVEILGDIVEPLGADDWEVNG